MVIGLVEVTRVTVGPGDDGSTNFGVTVYMKVTPEPPELNYRSTPV